MGCADVICDDCLRMSRIIAIDVSNRRLQIMNNTNRKDEVTILCSPVRLSCRNNVRKDGTGFRAAAQLNAFSDKHFCHLRKKVCCNFFVDEQGLCRIAHRGARNLCILDNAQCHREIRCTIHIDMTDTGTGLYDRNNTALDNAVNQPGPTTRDDDIEQPCQMGHDIDGSTILHCEQLDCACRDTGIVCSA